MGTSPRLPAVGTSTTSTSYRATVAPGPMTTGQSRQRDPVDAVVHDESAAGLERGPALGPNDVQLLPRLRQLAARLSGRIPGGAVREAPDTADEDGDGSALPPIGGHPPAWETHRRDAGRTESPTPCCSSPRWAGAGVVDLWLVARAGHRPRRGSPQQFGNAPVAARRGTPDRGPFSPTFCASATAGGVRRTSPATVGVRKH